MAETGMAAARYLDLLRSRAGQLLDQAVPGSYPRSLAAATGLIADRLADDDPAAAQLARLCAFLAPEPIPGGPVHRRCPSCLATWPHGWLTRWPGGRPWPI